MTTVVAPVWRRWLTTAGIALLLCLATATASASIRIFNPGDPLPGAGERMVRVRYVTPDDPEIAGYRLYVAGNDGEFLMGAPVLPPDSAVGTVWLRVREHVDYRVGMTSFYQVDGEQIESSGSQILRSLAPPWAEDPPAQDPPAEDPPAEDPPAEDPPAEDPPAEDPPAQDPPVADAPAPATLMHWWRLGEDPTDLGRDYGNAARRIDMDDAASGISIDDVQTNADGSYIEFDGATEVMRAGPVRLGIGTRWTLAAWVRPDRLDKDMTIFEVGALLWEANTISLSIPAAASGNAVLLKIVDESNSTIHDQLYAATLQSGRWMQIVVVFDSGNVSVYTDGEPNAVWLPGVQRMGEQADMTRVVSIAGGIDGSLPFEGAVHTVSLWNVALTPEQALGLYVWD